MKQQTIKPLMDRVLVRQIQEDEKSPGGIIIPESAKEKPNEGEIIAVGEGKVIDKTDGSGSYVRAVGVKVGERVLWTKYSGIEVKLNGITHLVLREEDLLGVIVEAT